MLQIEKAALERIVAALDQNSPARAVELNEDERPLVKGLQLLTMKPMIYAANVSESDLADQGSSNHHVKALREKAAQENCEVIIVSAQVGLNTYMMSHCACQLTEMPHTSSDGRVCSSFAAAVPLSNSVRLRILQENTFGDPDMPRRPVMEAQLDAQVEAELRDLDAAEAAEFLESLGASEGGLTSLINAAYRQLGLLTYFTTGSTLPGTT